MGRPRKVPPMFRPRRKDDRRPIADPDTIRRACFSLRPLEDDVTPDEWEVVRCAAWEYWLADRKSHAGPVAFVNTPRGARLYDGNGCMSAGVTVGKESPEQVEARELAIEKLRESNPDLAERVSSFVTEKIDAWEAGCIERLTVF